MAPFVRLWFADGQLLVEGAGDRLGLQQRDARSRCHVAPASAYGELMTAATRLGFEIDDEVGPHLSVEPRLRTRAPDPVHVDLLEGLELYGKSGMVELPRGPGREEFLLALLATAPVGALVVTAYEAARRRWVEVLEAAGEPAGGGGGVSVAMAGEGLDEALRGSGHRFGLVVVDEAARVGEGLDEALGRCVAPWRVGLRARGETGGWAAGAVVGSRWRERSMSGALEVVRLRLGLDEDEARDLGRFVGAAGEPGARVAAWSLAALSRRKREKMRELIVRHRGRRVAVLTEVPPGALTPTVEALTGDLPLAARGELLSMVRTGALRWLSTDDVPATGGLGAEVVVLTGRVSAAARRAVTRALSGRARVYELRTRASAEDDAED